jgi:hypothetical protein
MTVIRCRYAIKLSISFNRVGIAPRVSADNMSGEFPRMDMRQTRGPMGNAVRHFLIV